MEAYRKKIKLRIILECIVSVAALLLVAFSTVKFQHMASAGIRTESYLNFQMGLLFSWFVTMIRSLWIYARALKSDERLLSQYIKEHDERSVKILTEARSSAYWISVFGLLTATMVSSFYNYIVFFTLAGVVFSVGIIGVATKIFYQKTI